MHGVFNTSTWKASLPRTMFRLWTLGLTIRHIGWSNWERYRSPQVYKSAERCRVSLQPLFSSYTLLLAAQKICSRRCALDNWNMLLSAARLELITCKPRNVAIDFLYATYPGELYMPCVKNASTKTGLVCKWKVKTQHPLLLYVLHVTSMKNKK